MAAKRKIITLTLTVTEARAMSLGLGNTTSSPDAMEAIFPRLTERRAVATAHEKLDEAIRAVNGFRK